jgi:hypothetical protein
MKCKIEIVLTIVFYCFVSHYKHLHINGDGDMSTHYTSTAYTPQMATLFAVLVATLYIGPHIAFKMYKLKQAKLEKSFHYLTILIGKV